MGAWSGGSDQSMRRTPMVNTIKNILIFKQEWDICYNDKTGFQTIFEYLSQDGL
jgi:hypothetical protein